MSSLRQDAKMFMQELRPLQASWQLSLSALDATEQALGDAGLASSLFEVDEATERFEMKLIFAPDAQADIMAKLSLLEAMGQIDGLALAPLPQADWLQLVALQFPPIAAGRFLIYGSHISAPPPLGQIGLKIDAGAAFGTGEHDTTAGCLLLYEQLAKRRRFRRVLDMGCGTAILALAAVKRQPCRADGVDIDAMSIQVAKQFMRENRKHSRVRLQCGNGYAAPLVRGKYDLIFANILARPLMKMAKDLRAHLQPGGVAILSGLLNRQERAVLAAHRAQGLHLKARWRRGGWSALIVG